MKTLFHDKTDLLTALQSGDESAYKILFTNYYSGLLHYATGLTNDSDKAADIVQDTFIKLWRNRTKISIKNSIKSYLYSAVYHHFIDAYRKEKSQLDLLDQLKNDALIELSEKEESNEKERLQQIKTLINKLPPKCKEIFLLSKEDGLQYQEIGNTLNISIKTVEAQIGKAFKVIRKGVRY